jgi:hypothetical protein
MTRLRKDSLRLGFIEYAVIALMLAFLASSQSPPTWTSPMRQIEPHWEARYQHGALHISGSATTFPNEYSTASLARQPDDPVFPELLVYRVVFCRDKEPFCDSSLVGPVHYFERLIPVGKTRIRVLAPDGTFEFSICNGPR